jgi:AP-3 complex subunit beta
MLSQDVDVAPVFPSVVKNVVSANAEVKRLTHMYLVHYADVEPDTILLSIASFQKDMRGPNQLLRASALRVMSSIRVRVIVQPVVLAIRSAVIDSSAYVRKAACAALLKVASVDPELKPELSDILTTLLKDASTLVLGSAVAVFLELCPERIDIVHRVFRKLCHLIADMDEWGQVATLTLLTRYAKSQFLNPDAEQRKPKDADATADGAAATAAAAAKEKKKADGAGDDDEDELVLTDDGDIDPDHRLLLKSTAPLLQSRASSVVFAAALLHVELAPPAEQRLVGRALCRILRASRESQWVVLHQCATLAATKPDVLRAHMAEFFVSNDTTLAAQMKLEILTHLVDETNIAKLLREFATYVKHEDKRFVRATIQAIGRCATQIPAVLDSCIASLMRLLSNRSEHVVAESVIVLKRLLQTPAAAENEAVIRQLARLLDTIAVPTARAAITWLCGEYHARIALYAPDVLRQLARSFALEHTEVKLQVLTLGAKLFVARPDDVRALFEYVLTLAKYDQSYDVRDRARLLRALLVTDTAPALKAASKRLLEVVKPVPVFRSEYAARSQWTLGTLSHVLGQEVDGYEALPPFPTEAPPRSARDDELEVTSFGQAMSSDNRSTSYVPESHQGTQYNRGGKAGAGATNALLTDVGDVLSGGDDDNFYGDEGGDFYGDADEIEYDEYGGYYDADGNYVEGNGYYDDDGNWIENEPEAGAEEYYDETGAAAAPADDGWGGDDAGAGGDDGGDYFGGDVDDSAAAPAAADAPADETAAALDDGFGGGNDDAPAEKNLLVSTDEFVPDDDGADAFLDS